MSEEENGYKFNGKWSPEIAKYNFTQVPNLLLGCQAHLGLTDGELVTLIQLLTYWFRHESRVYPSITTLTKFSHKGYSTVQKRLRSLESKGFINRRHNFGTSNTYDLHYCARKLYQHQKVCTDPPRNRAASVTTMRSLPSSLTSNKEYEARRRNSLTHTENNVAHLSSGIFGAEIL